jgi:Domain of unknown function (DUF6265)
MQISPAVAFFQAFVARGGLHSSGLTEVESMRSGPSTKSLVCPGALAVVIVVILSGGVVAQERPDFSGTWTAAPDPAATGTSGRPAPAAFGQQFSIDHKGQTLTLTRTFVGSPATISYVLDGSETTSRMPGRLCEPDSGALWTAAWDGRAIALTMVGAIPPNGKPIKMDVKSTLRLESADKLRVEVIGRTAGQSAPRTTSTLYARSGAPPALPGAQTQKTRATLAQVAWISGVWIGGFGTSTFEERWTPPAGGSMLAVARTIRDGVMGSFEFLCLVERDGGLVYTAMPNGRSPATDFTLTKIDADSATFENPAHDFPKTVRYTRRPDGTLEAVISGDANQRAQTFVFKRQE